MLNNKRIQSSRRRKMIIHNRTYNHAEHYNGEGIMDTLISVVNGVIKHKDAIKSVVDIGKSAVDLGKNIKELVTTHKVTTPKPDSHSVLAPLSPPASLKELPDDVKGVIAKIRALQSGSALASLNAPASLKGLSLEKHDGFKYV